MFAVGKDLPCRTQMCLPNGLGDASVVNPPSVSDIWLYGGNMIAKAISFPTNWSWTEPGSPGYQDQLNKGLKVTLKQSSISPVFDPPIAPQTEGQMEVWNPDLLAKQTQFVSNQFSSMLPSIQGPIVKFGNTVNEFGWINIAAIALGVLVIVKVIKK